MLLLWFHVLILVPAYSIEPACNYEFSDTCASASASVTQVLKWRYKPYNKSREASIYGGNHFVEILKRQDFELTSDDNWDLFWTHQDQGQSIAQAKLLRRDGRPRLVNHCGYFQSAGQKCHFAGHIRRVHAALGNDPARQARFTYLRNLVLNHQEQHATWRQEVLANPDKPWVYKICNSGMSAGVEILSGDKLIDRTKQKPKQWTVVQEYLQNPFMGFGGRKFHLRVYVLVTQWSPSPHVFVYNEGVVFRSRHKYEGASLSDKRDVFSAISSDIEALPHRVFWDAIDDGAASHGGLPSSIMVREHMMDVIRYIFGEATEESNGKFAAFADKLKNGGYSCFDLYGLDVMFNERLEPFVLEINTGPNLNIDDRGEETSGMLQGVKRPLMQELIHWVALRLTTTDKNLNDIEDRTLSNFSRVLG